MLIHLRHEKGFGVHARGKGYKIDVVLEDLRTINGLLRADIIIRGIEGFDSLMLYGNKHVTLPDGLGVGVRYIGGDNQIYLRYTPDYHIPPPHRYWKP